MRQPVGRGRVRAAGHVLVVVGLAAALSSCSGAEDSQVVEPAAGHSWNQTHRVDLPAGWTVTARNVGPADESTSLSGPDSAGCLVSTSPAEPKRYWDRRPTAVTVRGHAASYGERDPDYGPYSRQVVWRADDRWFGVSCSLDRAGTLRLADAVRAEANPMRVPFRLTSAPDGVQMTQLIESVDDDVTTVTALFRLPLPGRRPLTMAISSSGSDAVDRGPIETQTIGGREVEVRRASQSLCLATRSDPICVSGPGDEPASDWSSPDARRVAEQTVAALVPAADVGDRTSWYDAGAAFPN